MSSTQKLYVGIDMSEDYTQISIYNKEKKEIRTLGENSVMIPTVLTVVKDKKEWFYGEEALIKAKIKESICIDSMLATISQGKKFDIYGIRLAGYEVLEHFFRKLFLLFKEYDAESTIKQLVISIEDSNSFLIESIYKALERMGIEKDRAQVQVHSQSYVYYTVCQKKELWVNNIGLFDYSQKGLTYMQLSFYKRQSPMVIRMDKKEYLDVLSLEEVKKSPKRAKYMFEMLSSQALYKQIISTLYVTGRGFEGEWADVALRKLCAGRRVFSGQNIYARGACFTAMIQDGIYKPEEFIFLSEDTLASTIMLQVYYEGKEEYLFLAKAGNSWYESNMTIEVMCEEEELRFLVKSVMKKDGTAHIVTLNGLPKRPEKMTRLSISLEFTDARTAILTIRDLGFGEFYPTSNRIWEKIISV